jgi:cytochrome c-type biogenesis protein CcmH
MIRALLLVMALVAAGPALAVQPDEVLSDPVLEARARALSAELRCPVCRAESIDESNADIARDLRLLVRERLQAGDTDAQVLDFMVARYGEYILLEPTRSGSNLILWIAGPLMLVAGGGLAYVGQRRRRPPPAPDLTDEEQARLRDLIGE